VTDRGRAPRRVGRLGTGPLLLWSLATPVAMVAALVALDPERPDLGLQLSLVASTVSIIGLFLAGLQERGNALAPVCMAALQLFSIYPFHGFVTAGSLDILERLGTDAEYWRAVASLWVAAATPFFWLGYRSRALARLVSRLPRLDLDVRDEARGTVVRALIVTGIGWLARGAAYSLGFHFHQVGPTAVAEEAMPLQFLVVLLADIPTIITTYLALIAVRSGERRNLVFLVPLVVMDILWGVLSGSRFKMVLPLVSLAVGLSRITRGVSLGRAAAGLTLFAGVVFPLTTAIRGGLFEQRIDIEREGLSTAAVGRSLEGAFDEDEESGESSAIGLLGERLHGLTSLALVIRYTPERHPYRLGEQFLLTPVVMVVPRLLWPDKPQPGEFTRIFKRFYWGSNAGDRTSVAPSQLGGFWSDFGFPGVFVGMTLAGLLFGFLMGHVRFGTREGTVFPIAVTSTLLLGFIQTFENEFAPLVEGLPKMLLIHYAVAWGLSTPRRRRASPKQAQAPLKGARGAPPSEADSARRSADEALPPA
jgi:hypothetical protein